MDSRCLWGRWTHMGDRAGFPSEPGSCNPATVLVATKHESVENVHSSVVNPRLMSTLVNLPFCETAPVCRQSTVRLTGFDVPDVNKLSHELTCII